VPPARGRFRVDQDLHPAPERLDVRVAEDVELRVRELPDQKRLVERHVRGRERLREERQRMTPRGDGRSGRRRANSLGRLRVAAHLRLQRLASLIATSRQAFAELAKVGIRRQEGLQLGQFALRR
jgi:hypothetical protein